MKARLPTASSRESRKVILVDDDADIREALTALLHSVGFDVSAFSSVEELSRTSQLSDAGCLVLDIRLSGQSGLAFQNDLIREQIKVPIVFISGHGDIPMAVRAIQNGAIEFLTKPLRSQDLIDAIHIALARDSARRESEEVAKAVLERVATLTPREKDVMNEIVTGNANKQIAFSLGISEPTVKAHRGQVMRKMQVHSLPDLVRMIADLAPGKNQ